MPNPITPAQFKALIPNPNAPMCDEMSKVLLQFPQAFWQWYNWAYNADGSVSTEHAQAICEALGLIGCAGGGGSSSTGSTSSGSSTTTEDSDAVVFAVTDTQKFITVNLATGAVTVIKTGTSTFYGLAQDPTDGTIFGLVVNGSDIDLVTLNTVTGNETVIAAAITGLTAPKGLTFDSTGVLYCEQGSTSGSCAGNGALKTIDKTTGVVSSVGGQTSRYIGDICFKGATMYGIGQEGCFTELRLFSINTGTGAVTTVAITDASPTAPTAVAEVSLAYVNSILYMTIINTIYQVNTGTGHCGISATYDNSTNGRIVGMALNQ